MKKTLKIVTLFLIILVTSCEAEKNLTHTGQKSYDSQKISLSKFVEETGENNFEPIVRFKYNSGNILGKSTNSKYDLIDFEIDTNVINSMMVFNKNTYTFKVKPKNYIGTNLFNLSYYKKNNAWEKTIVEMKPTADNLYKLQNGLTTKFEGEIKLIYNSETKSVNSKTAKAASCSSYTIIEESCNGCVGACDKCFICWTYTSFFLCDAGGDGGGGGYSPGVGPDQGGGGGSYSFPDAVAPDTTFFEPNTNNLQGELDEIYATKFNEFIYSLQNTNITSFNYLNQNPTVKNQIFNYLINNDFSSNSDAFAKEMINYCIANPGVTWEKIENWFMGKSEGVDGDYDAAFWENPNLTFPAQSLPSFNDFKNACPSKNTDAGTLCDDMGGEVLEMYNAVIAKGKKLNTCAIRISKAFQGSGIVIPELPNNPNGTKNTVKDKNGNNIIINAKTLNQWMRKTFGTNPSNYIHYTAAEGGYKGTAFPKKLENKQGIYSMISRPEIQKDWGTGHADLLENGECRQNCHFYDENNQFVPVDYIDIWILN